LLTVNRFELGAADIVGNRRCGWRGDSARDILGSPTKPEPDPMQIERLDHLVLTVADIARTCEFYIRVLGMEVTTFGEGRTALKFGQQKINLHPADRIPSLVADRPTPGSGDLCFITAVPLAEVTAHLAKCEVPIVAGPGPRAGAVGTIQSVYIRDPDQNLIEISNY
jgi:catechol 2,3-dioxygenase-like lactoylglutathione lyase family enzyme